MLGRSLSYLGVGLFLGLAVWRLLVSDGRPADLRPYRLTAWLCGLAGAALSLNATVISALNPFAPTLTDPALPPGLGDYLHFLLHTAYGTAWLALVAALTLAGVAGRRTGWVGLWGMAALAALALTGHAGDAGLAQPRYWLDLLHATFALAWLGGLAVLIPGRLGGRWRAGRAELRAFSRFALPAFGLAAFTGVVRAGLEWQTQGGLGGLYLGVLGLKVLAVTGVAVSAYRLRQWLARPAAADPAYDDGLSREVFFAAVLVLLTALLTQLAPR